MWTSTLAGKVAIWRVGMAQGLKETENICKNQGHKNCVYFELCRFKGCPTGCLLSQAFSDLIAGLELLVLSVSPSNLNHSRHWSPTTSAS